LQTVVAQAGADLNAIESRVEDNALIDAIQAVQLHYAKADVSLTSAFNPRVQVPRGPVSVRQIAALYLYDNELYAVEGNGRVLREALENAAEWYNQCRDVNCSVGPLLNRSLPGYNLDFAQGVTYQVDLRKPAGQRIVNLRFAGKPLRDEQPLRIAVNNYRAGGSGGYTMRRGLPVVWRSYEDIRDLMIRYYSERPLPDAPDANRRIIPESAQRVLEAEARSLSDVAATK
jgi:2',3'-cyclic-nucleotide 2'-phosphodiesterase/3'-nucleotidase